jgi:GNAT superfamily N-acetyltransferase
MTIQIHRATVEDWRQLKQIRLRALADAPTAFESTLEREQAFSDEVWRARIASSVAFLAFEGARAVGTACGLRDDQSEPGTFLLVGMYVDASARGTGCSHRLIDAIAEAAAALGGTSLRLMVANTNAVAMHCYLRHGFTETGVRLPMPNRPQTSEIEMQLRLAKDEDGRTGD